MARCAMVDKIETDDDLNVTDEMIDAGYDVLREFAYDWTDVTEPKIVGLALREIYKAMLMAKPKQTATRQDSRQL
jgi:hypothetical protein